MDRKTYTMDLTFASPNEIPNDDMMRLLVSSQMDGDLDDAGLECVAVLLKHSHRTEPFSEMTNDNRADRALKSLESYAYSTGMVHEYATATGQVSDADIEEQRECFLTVAGDFLADLFHAAHRLDSGFMDVVLRAQGHFEAEIAEEGE